MMKLTEIYAILTTKRDILKYAREVSIKQRDVKQTAISTVIEHYERSIKADERFECWYTPLVRYRCKKCGGVIMRVVGPFTRVTCGGNPAIGCILCSTVGSGRMLALRTDIVRVEDKD